MTEWTKTPPSEPGWYWWRDGEHSVHHPAPWNSAALQVAFARTYRSKPDEILCVYFEEDWTEFERHAGEWWPEPIEPPTEEPEGGSDE